MRELESKKIYWIFVGLFAFMVIILACSILCFPKKERFGTIDLQILLTMEAQKLASNYPNGKVPEDKLLKIISHLKQEIETLAVEQKLILLTKDILLGGEVPDYTKNLTDRLNAEHAKEETQ